jgi:hypothetical protein
MTEILPRWTGKLASLSVSLLIYAIGALDVRAISLETDGYHVQPGEEIQAAIESAATNPTNKHVWVHSGTYQPSTKRQALIWFNRKQKEGCHRKTVLFPREMVLFGRKMALGIRFRCFLPTCTRRTKEKPSFEK